MVLAQLSATQSRPLAQARRVPSQTRRTVVARAQQRQNLAQIAGAAAAASLLLASPVWAESSSAVEKLKGSFPGPQNAVEQRKALGDFVDKDNEDGLGIGRAEDATIDNPNDSPRPKDRTKMGQPNSSGRAQELQNTLDSTE